MRKVLGISILLVLVVIATGIRQPLFLNANNLENIVYWTGLFGIIGIGASFVIVTGGIDLSIGSVICLTGCTVAWLVTKKGWGVTTALLYAMAQAVGIGVLHGVLVAKMKLQPFIVTLCGLMVYRSITRWFTEDRALGFGPETSALSEFAKGKLSLPGIGIPHIFIIMAVLAIASAIFLNKTVYGRHMFAVGSNEDAARYSGINTHRTVILAYALCGLMSGIGGILFALYINALQPSAFGNFYETYAIAAAVLGGCSLRGGECSILGVVVGTTLLRVLYNAINLLGIPTQLEFAIIGTVILGGVMADELVKRYAARRRARG